MPAQPPALFLALRCIVATIATGLVAALVFMEIVFVAGSALRGEGDLPAMLATAAFLAMFAAFVAMPQAVLIGLLCELPKLMILRRFRRFSKAALFALHLVVSLVGAAVLLAGWYAGTGKLATLLEFGANEQFSFGAFMTGGATSAVMWWLLVLGPLHRSHAHSEGGHGAAG